MAYEDIRVGDRVVCRVPAGIGRHRPETKEAEGRAVMPGPAGWVLNMGGRHGTPQVVDPENFVRIARKARGRR